MTYEGRMKLLGRMLNIILAGVALYLLYEGAMFVYEWWKG